MNTLDIEIVKEYLKGIDFSEIELENETENTLFFEAFDNENDNVVLIRVDKESGQVEYKAYDDDTWILVDTFED